MKNFGDYVFFFGQLLCTQMKCRSTFFCFEKYDVECFIPEILDATGPFGVNLKLVF